MGGETSDAFESRRGVLGLAQECTRALLVRKGFKTARVFAGLFSAYDLDCGSCSIDDARRSSASTNCGVRD